MDGKWSVLSMLVRMIGGPGSGHNIRSKSSLGARGGTMLGKKPPQEKSGKVIKQKKVSKFLHT